MDDLTSSSARPNLISCKKVCQRTSLSRASVYREIAAGRFPKPVPLTGGRKGWVEAEVNAWIVACIAARDAGTV
jgi:prophage regulatory protein